MQVTETLSDGLRRDYSVVVPAADIESHRIRRLAELGRTVRLPGFRPGKIPATLLTQRFGPSVTAELVEEKVTEAIRQVITGPGLRPATQPRIELVSANPGDDLRFKVEVELLPDIALPDFAAIEITRLTAAPEPAQIAYGLAELAARQRSLLVVDEARPAAKGEFLTVDFIGTVDGVAFEGGTASNLDVQVAGPGFIPGFTDQLEGLSPGESRRIEVTFPADYPVVPLAGKPAAFEITAKALKQLLVPAVDDELAVKIGFEGLAELTTALKRRFQNEIDQLSRLHTKRQLLDALAATAGFPVPQVMVESEFAQIWQRLEADRKQGTLDAEDAGKTEEALRADYHAISERRVRLGLLLAEIARANGITVEPEELNRAIHAEAARHPGQEQQVLDFIRKNPESAAGLRGPIVEEKVVDFVLQLARVTFRAVTPTVLAREANGRGAPDQVAPVEAAPVEAIAVEAIAAPAEPEQPAGAA